jgi:undecaprenyl diphosphate synthase
MERGDTDGVKIAELTAQLHPDRMPAHVAIIMDGNGRWAQMRGFSRTDGHRYAIAAIRSTVDAAKAIGLKHLSLFAFSTENIERPDEEVNELFRLFDLTLDEEVPKLHDEGVRFIVSGELDMLPDKLADKFKRAVALTADNSALVLNMCVMYSGQYEIVRVAQKLVEDAISGSLNPEAISTSHLTEHMYHPEIPHPDLLIRTSGEMRLSNFMLWQLAYTELYFTPTLWPDFTGANLLEAILNYQRRERRFGKV